MRKYLKAEAVVVVLFIVAIVLGAMIYFTAFPSKAPQVKKNETSSGTMSQTEEILKADWSTLSQAENKRLSQSVINLSRQGDTIKIGANCQISPLAVDLNSSELKVSNTDKKPHSVGIADRISTISAGQTITFAKNELRGGILRYGCDGHPSGYIVN